MSSIQPHLQISSGGGTSSPVVGGGSFKYIREEGGAPQISQEELSRMKAARGSYLASLVRLNGRITLVEKEMYNFYMVEGIFDPAPTSLPIEMNGGRNIRVHCGYDLPIKRDHLISAVGRIETDPRSGAIFRITSFPLLMMATDKDSVVWSIVSALKGMGIGTVKVGEIFDRLAEDANGVTQVFAYLNYLSYHYHETNDFIFVRKLLDRKLSIEQAKKLLIRWYYDVNLGRLKLLGLTSEEIENSRMAPDRLFQKAISEPMQIPSITPEKSMTVYEALGKPCTDDEKYRGEIIRLMHRFVTKYGWSGVPSGYLTWKFPHISKHIDKMQLEHDLVGNMLTIYFRTDFEAEAKCASLIISLLKRERHEIYSGINLKDDPEETFFTSISYFNPNLNLQQKAAVIRSLNENISVIRGGAGTGKTTIIGELILHMEARDIPYQLVSFTGKAVARIKEVIKRNSPSTIHRLIYKVDPATIPKFQYLIVDEASMVTIQLFMQFYNKFGEANGFKYKIILIGDPHQLPPIPSSGPGMLFSEVIESGHVPTSTLIKNHRSDVTGDGVIDGIKLNSQALIDKILADPEDDLIQEFEEGTSEFRFAQTDNCMVMEGSIEEVVVIIELLRSVNPGLQPKDLKVICPYRNRKDKLTGNVERHIEILNARCQAIFETGQEKVFKDSRGVRWRTHDLVRLTKNNYAEGLEKMNGEEGIIIDIVDPGQELPNDVMAGDSERSKADATQNRFIVQFHDGIKVSYIARYLGRGESFHPRTLSSLTHAYASTVHESQGSEWEHVIGYLPIDPNAELKGDDNEEKRFDSNFLNYQLVYVMITRARKSLFLIGDVEEMTRAAVRKPAKRWDRLAKRIHEGLAPPKEEHL